MSDLDQIGTNVMNAWLHRKSTACNPFPKIAFVSVLKESHKFYGYQIQ
jgi:hypothetical protein